MKKQIVIGIHPDKIGNESYSEKWEYFLHLNDIEVLRLNLLSPDALTQAAQCNGVMWRWAHNPHEKQSAKRILYIIEKYLGIPVYPDINTFWHYDEKISQYYLLQSLNIPTPDTWLFWDREEALEWALSTSYPVIFKLSSGASSSNVLIVNKKNQAIKLINRMFRHGVFPLTMNEFRHPLVPHSWFQVRAMLSRFGGAIKYFFCMDYPKLPHIYWKPEYGYVYFQEFLHNNHFDTRITVIGNRAFGFLRMNRPNDFRASGSGNIVYEKEMINKKCIEMAFDISKQDRFQSMAYDFLIKNGDPVVCEISYAFADSAIYNCLGHWNSDLSWVEGNMWPEEAQVEDFIRYIQSMNSKDGNRFPDK